VHKISAEERNEGPRITIVTCGGARVGSNMMNGGKQAKYWVRKSTRPMLSFDPQKEKERYQRERKYVLGHDWGASTSSVPHVDHTVPEKPNGKVITITKFLRSCVGIIKDEIVLITLYDMIDHCT
jgi:hypothetical protein